MERNVTVSKEMLQHKLKHQNVVVDVVVETNNLFLFAYKIKFQHPKTGRLMMLRATVPEFMQPVMKFLELKLP